MKWDRIECAHACACVSVCCFAQGQTKGSRTVAVYLCTRLGMCVGNQTSAGQTKKEQRDRTPKGTMVGGDRGNTAFLMLSLSSLELHNLPFQMQMQHYSKRGQPVHRTLHTRHPQWIKMQLEMSTARNTSHKWWWACVSTWEHGDGKKRLHG